MCRARAGGRAGGPRASGGLLRSAPARHCVGRGRKACRLGAPFSWQLLGNHALGSCPSACHLAAQPRAANSKV